MNVKYTNPRISFDGKYWFISVGLEKEQAIVELTTESIGIDVGIKDLAICSNGMTFKNQRLVVSVVIWNQSFHYQLGYISAANVVAL